MSNISETMKALWKNPEYRKHMSEAHKGKISSEQREKMIAGIHKRLLDPEYHKKLSDAHKKRYQDPNERKKTSDAMKKIASRPGESERRREWMIAYWDDERKREHGDRVRKLCEDPQYRKKLSDRSKRVWMRQGEHERRSGENSPLWNGGSSYYPYCNKFNNALKEEIREAFGRKCFLCGTSETGKRHHIHHIDFDKLQGCNGKKWALLPLCISCHAKTRNNRFHYFNLLINYWALNSDINLF